METDEVRPITTTDLIQYTKLIHAMNDAGYPISGSCPGFPQDVPPPLRPLAQYKIGAEYSKFGGNADIPSIPIAEYIREMEQVMGRTSFPLIPLPKGARGLFACRCTW
jgi:hypothetical protein